jgi:hypothetical protein
MLSRKWSLEPMPVDGFHLLVDASPDYPEWMSSLPPEGSFSRAVVGRYPERTVIWMGESGRTSDCS